MPWAVLYQPKPSARVLALGSAVRRCSITTSSLASAAARALAVPAPLVPRVSAKVTDAATASAIAMSSVGRMKTRRFRLDAVPEASAATSSRLPRVPVSIAVTQGLMTVSRNGGRPAASSIRTITSAPRSTAELVGIQAMSVDAPIRNHWSESTNYEEPAMSSPRRHVEVHTFTPPAGGTVDTAETALLSLLTAIERYPAGSSAITAFTAAIRRTGEELNAAGGGEALIYVLGRIRIAAPGKAAQREQVLGSAWIGLPGWRRSL